MIEFLVNAVRSTILNPAWLIPFCLLMAGFWGAIAIYGKAEQKSEKNKRKKAEDKYIDLLKQYYHQYGDYLFEIDDLIKEIGVICSLLIHINKTPQEIQFDLQTVSKKIESKPTSKTGAWLMFLKDGLLIHPVNHKVKIYHVKINGNTISFSEQVADRISHDISENTGYKRWIYCLEISSHHMTDTADDIIWKDCIRYTVYNNTVLSALAGAMRTYYDISSCFLTGNKAVTTCNQYTNQLNAALQPYGIKTSMTRQNWQFYYNDAPITLEEVIKKLPDEVLSKRLDQPTSTPAKAPTLLRDKSSQFFPNAAQSYPTPLMEQPYISEAEYISQLEDLYRKFGNNAFHYLTSIQNQTGYSKEKIKIDLKKIRDTIDTISPPQYLQSKSIRPTIRTAQQAPVPPPKAPNKPSIEEELLNYLKTQPICWEFPLTTQDKALNKFCEALVFSDSVTGVGSNEAIKNLELTIQKKRARNPRLADHNAAMEGNILAILYEYSYLMHIFHALDDMKFDTTKVDIEKLWLLIQQDCNARINNLDEEKRKNPTIQIVLDKYKYDNQINRLKVLTDATGREMDYIISFIMAYSLLTVISLLFSNPQLLQPLKPYSADDIAGMMNALINVSAGLRFTGYSR